MSAGNDRCAGRRAGRGAGGSAQTERTGNADARVMQQLQQLSAERAALQGRERKLKQELEQAKEELRRRPPARLRWRIGRARSKRTRAAAMPRPSRRRSSWSARAARCRSWSTKFRETAQTLRDVETRTRAVSRASWRLRERELKVCVDRNAGLYNLNAEVLDRMENRGFWSRSRSASRSRSSSASSSRT